MYTGVTPFYAKLFDIYCPGEKPGFILPFLESRTLKRLAAIWQGCGADLTQLFPSKFYHQRLDHSIGVALIIRHFTRDRKATLAWLFHDVSHTVFAHVGDVLLGDAEHQTSAEQHVSALLQHDPVIMHELQQLDIPLSDVDTYEMYAIADNPSPWLSADRLEYTLSTAVVYGNYSIEDIALMYENISVMSNERGEPELWFSDLHHAQTLWLLSIENFTLFFRHVVVMAFLGEILKRFMKQQKCSFEDLYTMTDLEVIDVLEHTDDTELSAMRTYYKTISSYQTHTTPPTTDNFTVSSLCKKRYIDPLVQTPAWNISWDVRWDTGSDVQRLSTLSVSFAQARALHLIRNEERQEIDYVLKP